MSFLKDIFKKKPGGTTVGNLLRGVSKSVSGGALGNGDNKIEIGQTKTNAQLASLSTFGGKGTENDPYQLGEVRITPTNSDKVFNPNPQPGESYLNLNKLISPYDVNVKADNTMMYMIGGLAAIGLLVWSQKK